MYGTDNDRELFDCWNMQKQNIDTIEKKLLFREGDIWWCSFGKNIGVEEDGKNELFERPILILKKFNNIQFFGLPLTSKDKYDIYHIASDTTGVAGSIILSQGRVMSSKRLSRRIVTMSRGKLHEVRQKFSQLFSP